MYTGIGGASRPWTAQMTPPILRRRSRPQDRLHNLPISLQWTRDGREGKTGKGGSVIQLFTQLGQRPGKQGP